MIWKKMNCDEAKKQIAGIENYSEVEFSNLVDEWKNRQFAQVIPPEYREIRDRISSEYYNYRNSSEYEIDLRVGLALYELLLKDEYKLMPTYANDDDIWRYLSVQVFLDITYLREPIHDRFGKYFSHDRVYRHTKRIWLKQLWWWIHLGWQGDAESTYKVLKKYGSGRISQVLERAGKGYRVEVIRNLLKKAAERCGHGNISQNDFRAIMMLYYAKTFVVEPTLVEGGTEAFLDNVLDERMPRGN